ncbi:hypothetical protein [Pannonibacter phragmitetus]|uniref:hypothetical protein n=1 Tax=Pannonibacter phragmitetus TaxID=121719 RepID=UPI003D2EA183
MTLASIWFGLRNRIDEHGHVVPNQDDAPDVPTLRAHLPQITFAVAMAGLLLVALNDALRHDFLGQVFPCPSPSSDWSCWPSSSRSWCGARPGIIRISMRN